MREVLVSGPAAPCPLQQHRRVASLRVGVVEIAIGHIPVAKEGSYVKD